MNKLYTDEQRDIIFAAWRAGKNTKEISDFYGYDLDSLRGFVSRSVQKRLIPPAPKGKRKVKPNYCKEYPIVRKKSDDKLPGTFEDEHIPVIKTKPVAFKSIFERRV